MVLFVAAERREFAGFPPGPKRRLQWPVRWAVEYRGEWLMVSNGAGSERARAAVQAAVDCGFRGAVVSTGFCGALEASLKPGDIVAASGIVARGRLWPARLPQTDRLYLSGPVLTSDRVVPTAAEKQALAGCAVAVEMEAAGAAEPAADAGLPFYCIRSVTDCAGESFGLDFNRALRADGRFDTMQILTDAARHPFARIPELIRLQRRCAFAARTLGGFIADCRF